MRRVVIHLHKPTRNGDKSVAVLTNLSEDTADNLTISELYRQCGGVETTFQKLEKHLHSKINMLGYPKTAVFGVCLALVTFNLYAVVMAALRWTHRDQDIDAEVSEYFMSMVQFAGEKGNVLQGLPRAFLKYYQFGRLGGRRASVTLI